MPELKSIRYAAAVLSLGSASCLLGQSSGGWPSAGYDLRNTRWAASETTLNVSSVPNLVQRWAFTTLDDVSATPSVDSVENVVYFPDWSGTIYKLDAFTGNLIWSHKMTDYGFPSTVISRTTPALSGSIMVLGASGTLAKAGSAGAYIIALDPDTGSLLWQTRVDPSPVSIVTGSPVIYDGVAYVGVSSADEGSTAPTFRGSVVALSIYDGSILWQSYMTPLGYSGVPVWSSTPVVDTTRSSLYVTTGNNYVVPVSVQQCEQNVVGNSAATLACQSPQNYADSIVALDLGSGAVKWAHHSSASDAWVSACSQNKPPCPDPSGKDYDFGAGANLFTVNINGIPTDIVGAGSKAGGYFAVDPSTGKQKWTRSVGPGGMFGGIQWGTSTDNQHVYVALSNTKHASYTLQPSGVTWNGASWASLDAATGQILWQVEDPGMGVVFTTLPALALGPTTVANGVMFAASMSGEMYAFDASNGNVLWSFMAKGSVNAAPAIVNGWLYWGSGYHHFPIKAPIGTASNTFYAFSLSQ